MTTTTYNWQRYWVPRDGAFSFDSQGFLLPPASNAELVKYWKSDVVRIEELLCKPCLVFLGEPGIGKSHSIHAAAERTMQLRLDAGAAVLKRDLSSYSSDQHLVEDVFRSDEFLRWKQTGSELHVFLDSFDECLLRVDTVAELIAEQLGRTSSVQNLFFRVASRTAEWRTSLEDALKRHWGEHSVGVYELAPLTRDQVQEAARVQLSEPDNFVKEVVAGEVTAFAIKPLTLELLFRVWKRRGGSLPPTQREIYEQGCLELCVDCEKRQTPRLRRRLTAEQRLAVAAHIAAATMFCNRAAVWTGASQAQRPESDISLAELTSGTVTATGRRVEVTESAVREALDTGLFTSRGRNRLGWAHQTYGEFLAARYLVQENLTARQVFDLLTHSHDTDRKLIPQLQETAAWAALPGSELFTHLAQVQPDVLLRSDVATADARDKFALVEALMAAIAQGAVHGDWWGIRKRFRKLTHPGLAKQLRRHLSNRKQAAAAREEAVAMVESCGLNELLPFVTKLALDAGEARRVRKVSAATVARSNDSKLKKRLRPLALGAAGPDPDDELRGAGLTACWPEHLTAHELFRSLPEPTEGFIGTYAMFLRNSLVKNLSTTDLPTALAWAESQPERVGSLDRGLAELVMSILDHAAEHIEEDRILVSLAKTLVSRLRKLDFSHGGETPRLCRVLEARTDLRLKLVASMVEFFEDAQKDSFQVTIWGLRLLFPRDLAWLIERLQSAPSNETQKRYAHLVSRVFSIDDATQVNAVIEASVTCPVMAEVMPMWLKPVLLDSDEARKAKECLLSDQKLRAKFEARRKPELLAPSPADRLVGHLDRFEAGDLDEWWKLWPWLEVKEDGHWCEKHHHMDIRELEGWKTATNATKARLVVAAERYVLNRNSNSEHWFSRRNTLHYPAKAGFRALLLLANENRPAYENLPCKVWQQWMPAILRLCFYDELEEHRLLTAKAFDLAPVEAVEWTAKVVNEENKEGENLWILQKLPKKWSEPLGIRLLQRLRRAKLKPQCFQQLLSVLLEHRVPGALNLLRSKMPRTPPSEEKPRLMALHATRLLMTHGEQGDWSLIWRLFCSDAAFGKAVMEGFAYDYSHSPTGILKTLTAAEVGMLWEWMLAHYPVAEDPDRSRGGFVDTRHSMADLRDSLISYLSDIGTTAGCSELRRLIAKYPKFRWFRQVLLRGQEQMRRLTWQPVSPAELFQLGTNHRARLVQSGGQLLEVVVASLAVLQERLQGETPLAQFLWDGDKPKPEEAVSEWVKVHLEDDLKGRGIVLGREVQIHRFDRTDIHVTAVTKDPHSESFGAAKVIIEVKGDWHREVTTAMETQLAGRYLKDNECRHGLYLVGWFGRRISSAQLQAKLRSHLEAQAQALSKAGQTIQAMVLDCSTRAPASGKRKSAKRHSSPKAVRQNRRSPR